MTAGPTGSGVLDRPRSGARRRNGRILATALVVTDSLAVLIAGLLATYIRFGSMTSSVRFEGQDLHIAFWELAAMLVPLWVCLLAVGGLYELDRISLGISESGRVVRSLSLGVVVLVIVTYVAKTPGLSRGWTLLLWGFSVLFVVAFRTALGAVFALLRHHGHLCQRTLVVGSNAESSDIIRVLLSDPDSGLVPVGCVASSQAERLGLDYCSGQTPVVGVAKDLVSIVRTHNIDTVVIASSAFDHDVLARIIAELRGEDVTVHVSSGLFEVLTSRVFVTEVAGVPLITVRGLGLSRASRVTKRVFDLVIASVIILAGLPLWLIITLAVKLSSPGPILYAQERVGRDGVRFGMLKFRSMYADADERLSEVKGSNEATGPLFKMRDDPRVTPLGRVIRKYSIDEFPQLLNVLKGEMSLVGPRPPLPHEVEEYAMRDWRRLEVVPGMTGLWQVSGRSRLTFDEMVRLDLFYIENWSVALDLSLMVRTIPAVLFARGAY